MKIEMTFKADEESELALADQLSASARRARFHFTLMLENGEAALVQTAIEIPLADYALWHQWFGPCDNPECEFHE